MYGRKRTLAPLAHAPRPTTPAAGFSLDDMLAFLDQSFVTLWLRRTQLHLKRLREWYSKEDNVLFFSHFWLAEMPDKDRQELIDMEGAVLLDELGMALQSGMDEGAVSQEDVVRLRNAVCSEYPNAFFADAGMGCLDLVHILSCAETALTDAVSSRGSGARPFQSLLSAIKCNTQNAEYQQFLLAMRGFCLVSLVHAIVSFFDNLTTVQVAEGFARPGTSRGVRRPHLSATEQSKSEEELAGRWKRSTAATGSHHAEEQHSSGRNSRAGSGTLLDQQLTHAEPSTGTSGANAATGADAQDTQPQPGTYTLNPHKPLAPIPSTSVPATPVKPPGTPLHPTSSRVRAVLQRAEERMASKAGATQAATAGRGEGQRGDSASSHPRRSGSGGSGDGNRGDRGSSSSSDADADAQRPTTAVGARTFEGAVDEAFRAVKHGHTDVLYYYLTRGLVALDSRDGLGRTLLFVAALHRHADVVQFLLENKHQFDINAYASCVCACVCVCGVCVGVCGCVWVCVGVCVWVGGGGVRFGLQGSVAVLSHPLFRHTHTHTALFFSLSHFFLSVQCCRQRKHGTACRCDCGKR